MNKRHFLIALVMAASAQAATAASADFAPDLPTITAGYRVRVVTASWCGYCKALLRNLKRSSGTDSLAYTTERANVRVPMEIFQDDSGKALKGDGFPEVQLIQNNRIVKWVSASEMSDSGELPDGYEMAEYLKSLLHKN